MSHRSRQGRTLGGGQVKSAKFKDSPLGPIPQDWEVKRLGDLCEKIGSGATPLGGASSYCQTGIALIRSQNVVDTRFSFDGLAYINSDQADELANVEVLSKDVLLNITGDSVARVCTVPDSALPVRVNQHVCILRTIAKKCHYLYLAYRLVVEKKRLLAAAFGGGTRNALTKADVEAFTIPCPPLPEQQRIAEALGEVDKLIESLDEQIEKKSLIAKGVAHDLLSGAKRLPGFKGEWKSVRLGELSEIVTGGTPSTEVPAFWGGDIRWMNSGDVHLKRIHDVDGRITQLGYASSNARLIPIGSVVIALAGQGKTRGTVAITECELCTNQSIGAILPSEKHDSECLYYVLAMQYEKLRAASSGDGTRGGLSKKILEEYIVKLPVDIAEQQAIADLLGEQDAAIAVLEEKREKYARIKEGMMRDLLTGKVRMKGE